MLHLACDNIAENASIVPPIFFIFNAKIEKDKEICPHRQRKSSRDFQKIKSIIFPRIANFVNCHDPIFRVSLNY
jgi:hypothetical protein